ncbi:hypothetical protein HDU99_007010, partial [Rhizoclosmatium hyalinum]
IRPWIAQFAKDHGLTFHNYDFIQGNGIVLKCLHHVAMEVKESLKAVCEKVAEEDKKKKLM